MKRQAFYLVIVLLTCGFWSQARAAPSPQDAVSKNKPAEAAETKDASSKDDGEKTTSFWMAQKLRFSQNIFAGLATADFDAIAANANSMRALNKVEAFVRRSPAAYRTQLRSFQFSVDELLRTARKDNLDGATLAFTQMTISCVNCHKLLRASGPGRSVSR